MKECVGCAITSTGGKQWDSILCRCNLRLKMVKIDLKSTWNFTFQLLLLGVTISWTSIIYNTSTPTRTCPIVGLTLSTWLSCCQWAVEYFHFRILFFNDFSFSHQLWNEPTGDTITHYITYSIYTYDSIVVSQFVLLNELLMWVWVNFSLAAQLFFDSNSTGNREREMYSLLSHTFTLYYLAL
jgi:hypothetical protein